MTRDGVALFHRDRGGGKAAPVVLSGGGASPAPPLGSPHDGLPHGPPARDRSADPGRPCDFGTLADDQADMLEALDLRGADCAADWPYGRQPGRHH
ncbi:MAG: hypothetical protein ICV73_28360 [Acetobacteraceae bacterium]|nr:hypothetical protein [Acetobacteraceae bacterium]